MSTVSILLVAEGPHEIGRCRDSFAPEADPPPLAVLVKRLTRAGGNVRFLCRQSRSVPNIHRGRMMSRLGKKVYSAMWFARHGRGEVLDAVVFLSDRDGRGNKGRLSEMREGRDAPGAARVPCAVGLAVEAFDAWMLADENAIRTAGGDASKAEASPEDLRDPKTAADAIFQTRKGSGLGPKYAIVAAQLDLEGLERTCPQGFATFAEEVRERIGPVLARA